MDFQINDRVVYPPCGVGRIIAAEQRALQETESRWYYEVQGERSTAWVQAEGGAAHGLRPLTRKADLPHYRAVLRGKPAELHTDFRQRQVDLRSQLKSGSLQALCEVVRNLHGRGWTKSLSDADTTTLRRSSEALFQEWAASGEMTAAEAEAEIRQLLGEGRAQSSI